MTLLEFCRSFFPGEEIFVEHEETITVKTKRLLELEQKGLDSCQLYFEQVKPSDILGHVEPGTWQHYDPCPGGCCGCWDGTEQITLSEESTQIMKRFRLVIDPEVFNIDLEARRPYYRMRGRPVTEEQAFDIIRRTDNFFRYDMDRYHLKNLVGNRCVLDNVLYSPNFFPHPRGWVRPDGVIGANGITGTYPAEDEFVYSMLSLMLAFPYLDLMIGVTDWNEGPDYAWEEYFRGDHKVFCREDYPDFEENIVYGIWLHDGALELMAPARAQEKYREYHRLYSGANEDIFKSDYCEDNHIHPADFEYLKRCIRSHGLDPEEVLARYEWDPVEGLRYLKRMEQGPAIAMAPRGQGQDSVQKPASGEEA